VKLRPLESQLLTCNLSFVSRHNRLISNNLTGLFSS
jgi:hypothetical protein